jgi:2-methylcitrate dehydratase PrpD
MKYLIDPIMDYMIMNRNETIEDTVKYIFAGLYNFQTYEIRLDASQPFEINRKTLNDLYEKLSLRRNKKLIEAYIIKIKSIRDKEFELEKKERKERKEQREVKRKENERKEQEKKERKERKERKEKK